MLQKGLSKSQLRYRKCNCREVEAHSIGSRSSHLSDLTVML